MEKLKPPFVFQTDSEIVQSVYDSHPNYIVVEEAEKNNYCAIYFSSNNIYYPNDKTTFDRAIAQKNRFEWYGTRVPYCSKHIFVRDIHKQWFLTGISRAADSPEKLLALLSRETAGYKIVTLGSSAGGFAAVLYGSLLKADTILSFNGQFEVNSLLKSSSEAVDPILFRYTATGFRKHYFDVKPFITDPSSVFYLYSGRSAVDVEQKAHVDDLKLRVIQFNTSHHGIPFLKSNLPEVLKMRKPQLIELTRKAHHPIQFSIRLIGLPRTIQSVYAQVKAKLIQGKYRIAGWAGE